MITACGRDLAACDLNIRAAAAVAAADACGIAAAVGCDIAAGNCNIAGIFGTAVTAAADSGTVFAASGDNSSAGDGDIIAFTSIDIAADARTAFTAGGIQAAGATLWGGDGQIPGIPLVYTGVVFAALNAVVPREIQGHVALALCGDGGFRI